jgi:hypothetical protein
MSLFLLRMCAGFVNTNNSLMRPEAENIMHHYFNATLLLRKRLPWSGNKSQLLLFDPSNGYLR